MKDATGIALKKVKTTAIYTLYLIALTVFAADVDLKISESNILLPRGGQVLLKATPGCFQWFIDNEIISFDYGLDSSNLSGIDGELCSTNIIVRADLDIGIKRESAEIKAIDENGNELSCKVEVDRIDSLQMLTTFRQLYEGENETIALQAFDNEGNVFSSLEGLSFDWQSTNDRIVDITRLADTTVEVTATRFNLEVSDGFTDKVQVSGKGRGVSSIHASADLVIEGETYHVSTAATMEVWERLTLEPFGKQYILIGGKINYTLFKGSGIHRESIVSTTPKQCFTTPEGVVSAMNGNTLTLQGERYGLVTLTCVSASFQNNVAKAMAQVVAPASLVVNIQISDGSWLANKQGVFYLIQGREYKLRVEIFAEVESGTSGSNKTKYVKVKWTDGVMFSWIKSEGSEYILIADGDNSNNLLSNDSVADSYSIQAQECGQFIPLVGQLLHAGEDGSGDLMHEVKQFLFLTISTPIEIVPSEPIYLPLLCDHDNHGDALILQEVFRVDAIGGTGNYTWHTDSSHPNVVSVNTQDKNGKSATIESVEEGWTTLHVQDNSTDFNQDSVEVNVALPSTLFISPGPQAIFRGEIYIVYVGATDAEGNIFSSCESLKSHIRIEAADHSIVETKSRDTIETIYLPHGMCTYIGFKGLKKGKVNINVSMNVATASDCKSGDKTRIIQDSIELEVFDPLLVLGHSYALVTPGSDASMVMQVDEDVNHSPENWDLSYSLNSTIFYTAKKIIDESSNRITYIFPCRGGVTTHEEKAVITLKYKTKTFVDSSRNSSDLYANVTTARPFELQCGYPTSVQLGLVEHGEVVLEDADSDNVDTTSISTTAQKPTEIRRSLGPITTTALLMDSNGLMFTNYESANDIHWVTRESDALVQLGSDQKSKNNLDNDNEDLFIRHPKGNMTFDVLMEDRIATVGFAVSFRKSFAVHMKLEAEILLQIQPDMKLSVHSSSVDREQVETDNYGDDSIMNYIYYVNPLNRIDVELIGGNSSSQLHLHSNIAEVIQSPDVSDASRHQHSSASNPTYVLSPVSEGNLSITVNDYLRKTLVAKNTVMIKLRTVKSCDINVKRLLPLSSTSPISVVPKDQYGIEFHVNEYRWMDLKRVFLSRHGVVKRNATSTTGTAMNSGLNVYPSSSDASNLRDYLIEALVVGKEPVSFSVNDFVKGKLLTFSKAVTVFTPIAIFPTSLHLIPGCSMKVEVSGFPLAIEGGVDKDLLSGVQMRHSIITDDDTSSFHPATVSNDGVVTAIDVGPATLLVQLIDTDGVVVFETPIHVEVGDIDSIQIVASTIDDHIVQDGSFKLHLQGPNYIDALSYCSDASIQWIVEPTGHISFSASQYTSSMLGHSVWVHGMNLGNTTIAATITVQDTSTKHHHHHTTSTGRSYVFGTVHKDIEVVPKLSLITPSKLILPSNGGSVRIRTNFHYDECVYKQPCSNSSSLSNNNNNNNTNITTNNNDYGNNVVEAPRCISVSEDGVITTSARDGFVSCQAVVEIQCPFNQFTSVFVDVRPIGQIALLPRSTSMIPINNFTYISYKFFDHLGNEMYREVSSNNNNNNSSSSSNSENDKRVFETIQVQSIIGDASLATVRFDNGNIVVEGLSVGSTGLRVWLPRDVSNSMNVDDISRSSPSLMASGFLLSDYIPLQVVDSTPLILSVGATIAYPTYTHHTGSWLSADRSIIDTSITSPTTLSSPLSSTTVDCVELGECLYAVGVGDLIVKRMDASGESFTGDKIVIRVVEVKSAALDLSVLVDDRIVAYKDKFDPDSAVVSGSEEDGSYVFDVILRSKDGEVVQDSLDDFKNIHQNIKFNCYTPSIDYADVHSLYDDDAKSNQWGFKCVVIPRSDPQRYCLDRRGGEESLACQGGAITSLDVVLEYSDVTGSHSGRNEIAIDFVSTFEIKATSNYPRESGTNCYKVDYKNPSLFEVVGGNDTVVLMKTNLSDSEYRNMNIGSASNHLYVKVGLDSGVLTVHPHGDKLYNYPITLANMLTGERKTICITSRSDTLSNASELFKALGGLIDDSVGSFFSFWWGLMNSAAVMTIFFSVMLVVLVRMKIDSLR